MKSSKREEKSWNSLEELEGSKFLTLFQFYFNTFNTSILIST